METTSGSWRSRYIVCERPPLGVVCVLPSGTISNLRLTIMGRHDESKPDDHWRTG